MFLKRLLLLSSVLGVTAAAVVLPTPKAAHADKGPMWAVRYANPYGQNDNAYSLATDSRGNVYTAGLFRASNGYNMSVIKYDSNGTKLWQQSVQTQVNDGPVFVAVDKSNNVFLAGTRETSDGGNDYVLAKYSPAGAPLWTASYDGPSHLVDVAGGIVVDLNGNVYITGYSVAVAGVSSYDTVTIKYNAAGVKQWTKIYGLAANRGDYPRGIAVSPNGAYVYVTNESITSGTYSVYSTIAYTSAGAVAWQKTYNDPDNGGDRPSGIATDAQGNVIVTGWGYGTTTDDDYVTIKYNGVTGAQLWMKTYDGGFVQKDHPQAVTTDAASNVYVTGYADGATDYNMVTIKYNSAGVMQWTTVTDGPAHRNDIGVGIGVDKQGNVFVTGETLNTDATQFDFLTVKYNSAGAKVWQSIFSGPGDGHPNGTNYDYPTALVIDPGGNAIVAGYSTGLADTGDDWVTIKYPAANYTARKIAVGGDNKTRLLWNRTANNGAAVWRLPVAGGPAAEVGVNFNAPTGYEIQSFAVGPSDNKVRLLWNKPNGTVAAWTLNSAMSATETGYLYYPIPSFTGFTGYTAASDIAVSSDNLMHLVWLSVFDRTAIVYNLNATGGVVAQGKLASQTGYGWLPILDMGPAAADKKPRLIQSAGGISNAIYQTTLTATVSGVEAYRAYNPANYAFVSASTGGDGKTRILWEKTDNNAIVIWQVNAAGTIEKSGSYGAPANYTARSIAVDPTDNKVRLLWTGLDGKTALWTLKADLSAPESGYVYGPYN